MHVDRRGRLRHCPVAHDDVFDDQLCWCFPAREVDFWLCAISIRHVLHPSAGPWTSPG
ncbi:hypothetical protein ACFPRL_31425 [Pseudoclavibacter helvolus]